jgi:hypothetical protein
MRRHRIDTTLMENRMNKTLATLLLLSLVLTGCVVDPGRGYGDRGYGDRGWNDRNHAEYQADGGQHSNWNH